MTKKICVLKTDGINCENETRYACELAGGDAHIVHVNELRSGSQHLSDFGLLVIPGGFSHGDDIAAGRVLATELIAHLGDELREFVERDRLVLGICNGFQVLVRAGLLPEAKLGQMQVTLALNMSAHFECRWVELVPQPGPCLFTENLHQPIQLPVANAEGRLGAAPDVLNRIEEQGLAPLRYGERGAPTDTFPANPNGSINAIAALCDPSGRIFGMMPHPERYVVRTQNRNWRRGKWRRGEPHGLAIFRNAVAHI